MHSTRIGRRVVTALACAVMLTVALPTTGRASDEGGSCSLRRLAGSYAFTATASTPGGTVIVWGVGVATVDRDGNFTGSETFIRNGTPLPGPRTLTGTFTMNADCTFVLAGTVVSPLGTETFEILFVFDDGFREARGVVTTPGPFNQMIEARRQ